MYNRLDRKFCDKAIKKEGEHVIRVLQKFARKDAKFLDAGSGLCMWTDFVHQQNPEYKISCLDINKNLIKKAIQKGYDAKVGSVLKTPYEDGSFDVVHCSHVIEHFGYPDVLTLLNELFRITKPGGIVIIKSLLDGDTFYNDIDHVRPYYPETLINYLYLEQQQSKATINATELYRWYVQYPPVYPKHSNKRTLCERIRFLSWCLFKIPKSTRILYGIVFRKEA